jgi:hypothetical protein
MAKPSIRLELVGNRYAQKENIDFQEEFPLVVKMTSMHYLI